MSDKFEYVISRDGTMIPADSCVIVALTAEQSHEYLDDMSDSERWEAAVMLRTMADASAIQDALTAQVTETTQQDVRLYVSHRGADGDEHVHRYIGTYEFTPNVLRVTGKMVGHQQIKQVVEYPREHVIRVNVDWTRSWDKPLTD